MSSSVCLVTGGSGFLASPHPSAARARRDGAFAGHRALRLPRARAHRPGWRHPRRRGGRKRAGRRGQGGALRRGTAAGGADEIRSTDVGGTQGCWKPRRAHDVARFIFISSTAVYGIPDHHPVIEPTPARRRPLRPGQDRGRAAVRRAARAGTVRAGAAAQELRRARAPGRLRAALRLGLRRPQLSGAGPRRQRLPAARRGRPVRGHPSLHDAAARARR